MQTFKTCYSIVEHFPPFKIQSKVLLKCGCDFRKDFFYQLQAVTLSIIVQKSIENKAPTALVLHLWAITGILVL